MLVKSADSFSTRTNNPLNATCTAVISQTSSVPTGTLLLAFGTRGSPFNETRVAASNSVPLLPNRVVSVEPGKVEYWICRFSGLSDSIAEIPAAHEPAPFGVADTLLTNVTVQAVRIKMDDFIMLNNVPVPTCEHLVYHQLFCDFVLQVH